MFFKDTSASENLQLHYQVLMVDELQDDDKVEGEGEQRGGGDLRERAGICASS